MSNQSLIASLSEEAKISVCSPWGGAMRGLGFSVGFLFLLGSIYSLRPDLALKLAQPVYLTNLILLGLTAIASASVSCWIAIPDLQSPHWVRLLPFIPAGLWALSLVVTLQQIWLNRPELIHPHELNMFCIKNCMLFLLLPGTFQFAQIKRLAPVLPAWSGALSLLLATSMGNFALMLLEQNDGIYHQLAWHLAPTILFTLLGFMVGKKVLHW